MSILPFASRGTFFHGYDGHCASRLDAHSHRTAAHESAIRAMFPALPAIGPPVAAANSTLVSYDTQRHRGTETPRFCIDFADGPPCMLGSCRCVEFVSRAERAVARSPDARHAAAAGWPAEPGGPHAAYGGRQARPVRRLG